MVGIVVISETKASAEMLKTVSRVLDKKRLSGVKNLVIQSDQDPRTLKSKINQAIKQVDDQQGVVIFTELYGSTQSNVCLDFLVKDEVELIAGYNIPMLLKAITLAESSNLKEMVIEVVQAGQKYIKAYDGKNNS